MDGVVLGFAASVLAHTGRAEEADGAGDYPSEDVVRSGEQETPSEVTVKGHLANVYEKMDVGSFGEAPRRRWGRVGSSLAA